MKLIREGVFETNSSSTHSVTISRRKPKVDDIPRGVNSFLVSDRGDISFSDESVIIDRCETEMDKLSFVINMLASVCNDWQDDNKMFLDYDYDKRYQVDDVKDYMTQFWLEMINSELFTALKDCVYEVTGTTIEFERPDEDYIPFYGIVYSDEGFSIEEILGIENGDLSGLKDKLKELIFDKEITIINSNIPYGCEGDWIE